MTPADAKLIADIRRRADGMAARHEAREQVANLRALADFAVEVDAGRDEAEAWKRVLTYWLLRAYVANGREGFEDGPSADETFSAILDVLANAELEPDSDEAHTLLAGPARCHPDHVQARERPEVATGARQTREALERRAVEAVAERDDARAELAAVRKMSDEELTP